MAAFCWPPKNTSGTGLPIGGIIFVACCSCDTVMATILPSRNIWKACAKMVMLPDGWTSPMLWLIGGFSRRQGDGIRPGAHYHTNGSISAAGTHLICPPSVSGTAPKGSDVTHSDKKKGVADVRQSGHRLENKIAVVYVCDKNYHLPTIYSLFSIARARVFRFEFSLCKADIRSRYPRRSMEC